MWVTGDVRIPEAILTAHSEGRLVFFVGAGASIDSPSDLPLFDKLAEHLAGVARVTYDSEAPIDLFLGSMPDNFDTHEHARRRISQKSSAPNSTHVALVQVAAAGGPLRVVTTNFDNHLSTAAAEEGVLVPDQWTAPALPLGDDFAGIVHLHGSVLRDAQELVLTDVDFGRAYLTQAWATRFLLPMFQKFTVLFVGYSHDDPIMRYLGLGLPPGTPRFVLTSQTGAGDPKWARLGVKTIEYPVHGNDHSALLAALQAWNNRARMGKLDHQARMKTIVEGSTTLSPVEHDYLADRLTTLDGAHQFAQAVDDLDTHGQLAWLLWIEDLPEFRTLFAGSGTIPAASILSTWFCKTFIASPELHSAALQTVQRLGQAFSSELFQAAGWAAGTLVERDPGAGRRWKAMLATSIEGHSTPANSGRLMPYRVGEAPEDMSVLRAALRPSLSLTRRLSFNETADHTALPDAEVRWSGGSKSLSAHIQKAVDASTAGDAKLAAVLEDSLNAAYDLSAAYFGGRKWDPMSFGRSAIEPHPQDAHHEHVDAVIDGLRAFGEKAIVAHPQLPERWWSIGTALFRRLAIHLVTEDASRDAGEKLAWLLDRSLLYATEPKHETYRLLQSAVGLASAEQRERLLAAVAEGPAVSFDAPDSDRYIAYAKYNLLVWLTGSAPEWSMAGDALKAAQAANPDFAPREHPDLDHWMTSGTWGGSLPMEPAAFAEAVDHDASAAMDDLIDRDYSAQDFGQPEWRDALALVSEVVQARPALGELIWMHVAERTDIESKAGDLRRAIIEGWGKTELGLAADTVVGLVRTELFAAESARTISRFLLDQIRRQIESHETLASATMRSIAASLWHEHGDGFTHTVEDPVSSLPLYLNSWPGELAQYWMTEIDRRWRGSRDDWSGLSEEEREALNSLLAGPTPSLDATVPAITTELFFLFAADAEYVTERVLSLFETSSTRRLAWTAYLHRPRYNDKLLAAGFLDHVIAEWDRLDELSQPALRTNFYGLVASIVSFAGIAPEDRQRLLDQSALASNGERAASFAESVVYMLRSDGIAGAELWKLWLHQHLDARLNGIPRTAGAEELARWADAVPHLGEAIPEAVAALEGRGVGLGERFHFEGTPHAALEMHGDAIIAHLSDRIRFSSPAGFGVAHAVSEMIAEFRTALGDAAIKPLEIAAAESGIFQDETD